MIWLWSFSIPNHPDTPTPQSYSLKIDPIFPGFSDKYFSLSASTLSCIFLLMLDSEAYKTVVGGERSMRVWSYPYVQPGVERVCDCRHNGQ